MKGYKAFEKGMICRGKQYAENTVFEEDKAVICVKGMHFCERPLDVLRYYTPVNEKGEFTEFAEVEALDDPVTDDNIKYCSKKLKIGVKVTVGDLVNATVDFVLQQAKSEPNTGDCSASSHTGYYSASSHTGYRSASSHTGDYSASIHTGDYSASSHTGDCSASSHTGDCSGSSHTGYRSASSHTGNYSASSHTGNYSASSHTGNYSASSHTGDCSATVATGHECALDVSGKSSIAVSWGAGGKAKGAIGSYLVLSEWDNNGELVTAKMAVIDGKKIKAGTWYKLKNGEFVEVDNAEA